MFAVFRQFVSSKSLWLCKTPLIMSCDANGKNNSILPFLFNYADLHNYIASFYEKSDKSVAALPLKVSN